MAGFFKTGPFAYSGTFFDFGPVFARDSGSRISWTANENFQKPYTPIHYLHAIDININTGNVRDGF